MSIQIVGSYRSTNYKYEDDMGYLRWVDEVVATFDDVGDAHQYIENSRLKNPKNTERPFKKASILSRFERVSVQRVKDPPPHNPQLGKRRK